MLGAGEILLSERAPLPLVIHIGLQGVAGYLVPLILLLCGILLLINPTQRMFYAVLAIILALLSWVTSNLGGFFIGMVLGVIGGSLALAWTTTRQPRSPRWLRRKPSPGSDQPSAGLDLILGDRDNDSAHAAAQAIPRPRSFPARALPACPLAVAIIGVAVYQADHSGPQPLLKPGVSLAASVSTSPSASASPTPLRSSKPSPTTSASPSASPAPTVGVGPSPVGTPPQPGRAPPGPPRVTATIRGPGPAAAAWMLTAGSAAVTGLRFDGVARVRTARRVVYMLKFSLGSMVLSGGTGLTFAQAGRSIVTSATSLNLSGDITLYATKISGELGGRMVVYTPSKPPVNLSPDLTLANVVASQPYATADTFLAAGLTITEPAS
jgi:hypothetical protein